MNINKLVFEQIATKYRIKCTHPALLLFAESKKDDLEDMRGINEFVAAYDDDGFILLDWMNERGFVTSDINAAILTTNVKTVPIDHPNWPALVDEDARTLELLNAMVLWRRGVASEEDVLKAIETFKEASNA